MQRVTDIPNLGIRASVLALIICKVLTNIDPWSIPSQDKPEAIRVQSALIGAQNPSISQYDQLFHDSAKANMLDWRLVASISFVESSFRPNIQSYAGAAGLMQIMPVVAREYSVKDIMNPKSNIAVGVRHFLRWRKAITADTPRDRTLLALAAYNAGLGHLRDAQDLAKRLGKNPKRWSEVKPMFALLEKRRFYRKARYGFCRGSDTIHYVDTVISKYDEYRWSYPELPPHLKKA